MSLFTGFKNNETEFTNRVIFDGIPWLDKFEGDNYSINEYAKELKNITLETLLEPNKLITKENLKAYGLKKLDVEKVDFKAIAYSMKNFEFLCEV